MAALDHGKRGVVGHVIEREHLWPSFLPLFPV